MRAGKALTALAMLCALLACESAEQKCRKARDAAHQAWTKYVAELDRNKALAVATQAEAHAKMSGPIERRLGPDAQNSADARYNRSSSEAWLRAYESAFNAACAQDTECAHQRKSNVQAAAAIEDLDERLSLAKAAASKAMGPVEAAKQASEAVIIHVEYPAVKSAQALTLDAYERCGED